MATTGRVRIGISGWTYAPWRGVFYPATLPAKRQLAYASGIFPAIEVNGTFYSLQRPSSFARWLSETPEDFVFAIKGSRYITHMLKLKGIETPLANFFASGLLRLGPKLGPLLWQFPPFLPFDSSRFEAFLALLPRDSEAAAELASRHHGRLKGRAWTKTDARQPLRHAVEIRHQSFVTPAFVELLRAYGVALVCADAVEWPLLMDLTADFVYTRLHGSEEIYSSGYDDDVLDQWAARIVAWARGSEPDDAQRVIAAPGPERPQRDVYVFFDNDAKVRAPVDAQGLIARVEARLGH